VDNGQLGQTKVTEVKQTEVPKRWGQVHIV